MPLLTETIKQRNTERIRPTILNPRPVTVYSKTPTRRTNDYAAFPTRSQEGGIEGFEMNRGWVFTSDLALPVDHETQAEKEGTEQMTTGTSLCISLTRNFRNYIYSVHRPKNSSLSWPVFDTNAQTEQYLAWGTYTVHLWSSWRGGVISELWFRPVFRPTTREFSILIFYLFVFARMYNTGRKGTVSGCVICCRIQFSCSVSIRANTTCFS